MFRGQGQGGVQGVLPLAEGLAGQAVHQVQADVVEAGAAAMAQGGGGFGSIVAAAQHRQQGVVHTLDADADAVDAGGVEVGAARRGEVVGVALGGDFGIVGEAAGAGGHSVQNAGHGAGGQVGGGAAAEEDGVHRRMRQNLEPGVQLGADGR